MERPLRSRASLFNALLLFNNTTERKVNVYWADYEGLLRKLITLNPGEKRSTNTYSTHPWVFKDFLTGESMQVENNEVYWPQPLIVVDNLQNHRVKRRQVDIHFPMRSLRQISLWTITTTLNVKSDIDKLEIPTILKIELLNNFKEYEKFRRKILGTGTLL